MKWGSDPTGSFHSYLPPGCRICATGASLVLFVTGLCQRSCFYCPLSVERKGRDLVLANESCVSHPKDILKEAWAIDAKGTGITGGEPLIRLERVLEILALLKAELGMAHHVHLYTGLIPSSAVLERLAQAGLDEIRLHPELDNVSAQQLYQALREASKQGIEAGVEIPALVPSPGISDAVRRADAFLNLNELEFSETNQEAMKSRGFCLSDDTCAAMGSRELARTFMEDGLKVHFCSSVFKDAVQLRERLKRRAARVRRKFDEVTEDGTLIYGVVEGSIPSVTSLLQDLGVPGDLYSVTEGGLELAAWVLEDLASDVRRAGGSPSLVERYPLEGGLVVERIPL
ncbi:MAG TPA: radical SAM protein [Methanotrichaceae archaeon]|nr:radical SAM protein [Methanotrichaceae archaeon]HQF16123.1 radical SAM protein [Methanotrichaceae archaeon]